MGFTSSAVRCVNGICTNGMNCVHCGMPVEREERYSLKGFNNQRLCNECRSLAIDLYQHGERQRGIAREMGISNTAVRRVLIQESLVDGGAYGANLKRGNRDYYERHHEDILRYMRDYNKTERSITDRQEYQKTEEYKAYQREYHREYYKNQKAKEFAT